MIETDQTHTTIATSSPRLHAKVAGVIATVVINAPERRNCVDLATWKAFPGLFAVLDQRADVCVILLRGAGTEAFCAGADIAEFETERATPEGSRAYEMANTAAFDAVAAVGKPVIAVLRGFCFGAGVGLAASADLRIASADAVFSVPAARLGVGYPPTALRSLVALMGPEAVKRLFFAAGRLNAAEALRLGFVGEVVPGPALDEHVMRMATDIARGAPMTILAAKRAIDAAAGSGPPQDAATLQALADACFASADYAEGRAAFREKRSPTFIGR